VKLKHAGLAWNYLCYGNKNTFDADKKYLQLRFWVVTFQGGSAESPSIPLSRRFMHSQLLGDQNYHHRHYCDHHHSVHFGNCFGHFICCFWCDENNMGEKISQSTNEGLGWVELISGHLCACTITGLPLKSSKYPWCENLRFFCCWSSVKLLLGEEGSLFIRKFPLQAG